MIRKYTLAFVIFAATLFFVALGVAFGGRLKVAFMSSGDVPGSTGPANTPNLVSEEQSPPLGISSLGNIKAAGVAHPPPSHGDHQWRKPPARHRPRLHPPEEKTTFPVAALALPRRQHQGGRRG